MPRLAQLLARVVAMRTKEWLASRLAELGYPIGAIATDKQYDEYRPSR